ncbi:MAG TPA: hypothetical protein VEA99_21015 [Gemmatimonadaceae bacterium]|nr:hypothetical protein [Gemmatimonadaceae bacterium]
MPRWLFISMAIVAAQFLLAYLIGGLLRRAAAETSVPGSAEPSALPRSRPAMPRRFSGRRRVVGR